MVDTILVEYNRETVRLAEEYVAVRGDNNPESAITGRRGIIAQLQEASTKDRSEEPGEFTTLVFFLTVKETVVSETQKKVHLQVIKAPMLFNSEGDFEENLVKYGIN